MKNLSPFAYVQCAKVASKRYTEIHEYIMVFQKGEYEIPDYCEQDELRVNSNKFFSYE